MAQKEISMMRTLAINNYSKPGEYELIQQPIPEIKSPDELIIKIHAASINPADVKLASGAGKMYMALPFPYILGYDLSGTVIAAGSAVPSHLKPGTEVYGLKPENGMGTMADYAISNTSGTALKPLTISHIQAASVPLVALTALQALDIAETHLDGGLKGKTVYIPGGLSGTGSIAIQLAKNCFGVAKVITTLSPPKILKVESLLGKGLVDQIIDYTNEDPAKVLARASVDFMYDTMGQALGSLHLMKKGGVIVSVSSMPFGPDLKRAAPELPLVLGWILNGLGVISKCRARRYDVEYRAMFVRRSAEDLSRLSKWIDEGLMRPIVGRVSKLDNLEEVREGCLEVFNGKGGIGKFAVEIDGNRP